jgi:hypothetical protein
MGIPAQPDFTDKVKGQAGSGQRSRMGTKMADQGQAG